MPRAGTIALKKLFILERDGWKCKKCGVKTPKKLYGKNHPQSPTVGHIIPACKGGKETPKNLRCECQTCNVSEGGRLGDPKKKAAGCSLRWKKGTRL